MTWCPICNSLRIRKDTYDASAVKFTCLECGHTRTEVTIEAKDRIIDDLKTKAPTS